MSKYNIILTTHKMGKTKKKVEKMKKMALVLVVLSMVICLAGCGKKCENGCGDAADSQCMAGMCDNCCDYWMGLNGCYKDH